MSENIDVVQCAKFLSRLKKVWLIDPDNPIRFKKGKYDQFTYYPHVLKDLCDFMVSHLQERYQGMLIRKKISLEGIRLMVDRQPINNVYWRIMDMVNIWAMQIDGPVGNLGKIATDSQSVHTVSVTKSTNDGIFILEKQEVPSGQKTVSEIREIWLKNFNPEQVERLIKDMKDWGSRPQVMDKKKNMYKSVLRGLWAKIKSFDDAELKAELVKRLFEECSEALGMCADGHVGRLVNVLIGYDEQFKNHISPKEYFQNNMALIAKSEVPLAFKLDQAKKLMEEAEIPQEERTAWLEAF
jgi:hypothetical protein